MPKKLFLPPQFHLNHPFSHQGCSCHVGIWAGDVTAAWSTRWSYKLRSRVEGESGEAERQERELVEARQPMPQWWNTGEGISVTRNRDSSGGFGSGGRSRHKRVVLSAHILRDCSSSSGGGSRDPERQPFCNRGCCVPHHSLWGRGWEFLLLYLIYTPWRPECGSFLW